MIGKEQESGEATRSRCTGHRSLTTDHRPLSPRSFRAMIERSPIETKFRSLRPCVPQFTRRGGCLNAFVPQCLSAYVPLCLNAFVPSGGCSGLFRLVPPHKKSRSPSSQQIPASLASKKRKKSWPPAGLKPTDCARLRSIAQKKIGRTATRPSNPSCLRAFAPLCLIASLPTCLSAYVGSSSRFSVS